MHTPISAALRSIDIAPPVRFENLLMFPLVLRDDEQPGIAEYRTLDDGLNRREVEITEISEQGSVPELRVLNRGSSPVLIVDGEELVGAKQNRVVNLTILVAPQSELTIPVSCVEAGRWRARSRAFTSAPRAQYSSGRAKRMSQVTRSLANDGMAFSDQAQVWSDIADKFAHLKASSPTGAMEALFTHHGSFIDACVERCQPIARQVGALFTIDHAIVGFDLFDSPDTLRSLLPKLVRSVALDALDRGGERVSPPTAHADHGTVTFATGLFLGTVSTAGSHASPGVGLGTNLRLTGQGVTGAALAAEGRVVHLSAFALN
jgi:hypothetical protein